MEYKSKMGQNRRWSILPSLRRRAIAQSKRPPAAASHPTLARAKAAVTVAAVGDAQHADAPAPLSTVATPSRKDGSGSKDRGGIGGPVGPDANVEDCIVVPMASANN